MTIPRFEVPAITNAKSREHGASAQSLYHQQRVAHWDAVAARMDGWTGLGKYYHKRLTEVYLATIPTGQRVLEIGCAQGDLLASCKPAYGVGVDFSGEMIRRGRAKYPDLRFYQADVQRLSLEEKFDTIIMSDLVNDLWDVQAAFQRIGSLCTPRTRLVMNFYSHVWALPLRIAQRLHLAKPLLSQNWLTVDDVSGLLHLTDFEVIRHFEEILLPFYVPGLTEIANRYVVKLSPFRLGALTHFIVARPLAGRDELSEEPLVSVVIPARNESGNIADLFDRVPEMGRGTELIFVEGHSTDETHSVIEKAISEYPERRCKLLRQTGKGKGDAVRLGFANASGDVLMILDADLTVPPEDLVRFLAVLQEGKADFVNGVRLVYPMEKQAMRFLNLVGNKLFSLAFSFLLGQPIKDTLCGTKVLRKSDYALIEQNREYFGDFDPFGDFDLIFGAARLNLKIVDLPVRYRDRVYGSTNIERWKHGWLLFRMVQFAARRIKFI
ncbi:MAG TPA: bifunctional class I SAM-dependent methyltransferase/glycosyltransferase family 2 protein [Blastocatellia bacterium]|nr:bifunctional class I SAM-dependent methyltransferase/glycosyltransferase family 2 protein [Blastocatellia bacterium]